MCPSSLVLTVGWPITVWIHSQDKLYDNPTLLDANTIDEISQTFLSTFLSNSIKLYHTLVESCPHMIALTFIMAAGGNLKV